MLYQETKLTNCYLICKGYIYDNRSCKFLFINAYVYNVTEMLFEQTVVYHLSMVIFLKKALEMSQMTYNFAESQGKTPSSRIFKQMVNEWMKQMCQVYRI